MDKSLKLELLSMKDEQLNTSIQQRRAYRKMSTFISPRDVHQFIDMGDQKIISSPIELVKQSKKLDDNQRMNSLDDSTTNQNNDYIQNKIQHYFDKKMREEIEKSVGRPIPTKKDTSTKQDKTMNDIIHHMKESKKQCQLAKQMAEQEVKKVILRQNEEYFKSRPSTSQQLINNQQKRLKFILQKSPSKNISQSRISSEINSFSSLNEIDKLPSNTENQRSKAKILQKDNYQLNKISQKLDSNNQINIYPFKIRRSSKKDTISTQNTQQPSSNSPRIIYQSKSPHQENQNQSKSPCSIKEKKIKSAFHELYSKRGTLDNSQIFDEYKNSSKFITFTDSQISDQKVDKLIRKTPAEKQLRIQDEQRQKTPEKPSKGTFSDVNISFNSNVNVNSYIFDGKQKSGVFSPKRQSNLLRFEKPNSTFALLDSSFKRNSNPQNQKIQFLQQMNEIVGDVQEVCNELVDDVQLYLNQTEIKKTFNNCIKKMNEKQQLWLEDPKYQHVKEKLKQQKHKKDLESHNGIFHPYYQFLGYDRLDQLPRDRGNQEVIEQRYAYYLHKNGVDLAHQTLNNSPSKQERQISLNKINQEQKMKKLKNILEQCNSKSQLYRQEDEEREKNLTNSNNSSDSFCLIKNLVDESAPNSPSKARLKSTFIPKETPRKQSLLRQFNNSQESTQKSFSSLQRQHNLNQFVKNQESLPGSPRNQRNHNYQQEPEINSTKKEGSEAQIEVPKAEKIGELEKVPIVKQVLTRYGRINNKEGGQIISKIQTWRQQEEQLQVIDKEYFFTKMEEQKQHLVEKYENQQYHTDELKKIQFIEKIKNKFSSKQKLTIEKMYRQEKEWEEAIDGVQKATTSIDRLIHTARSRMNSLKTNDSTDPEMKKLYKRSSIQTGMIFYDKNGRKIK